MTCLPAPIANSVSVAVGESDTMRRGFLAIVTFPSGVVIVTGKADCAGSAPAELAPAAPATNTTSAATNETAATSDERST